MLTRKNKLTHTTAAINSLSATRAKARQTLACSKLVERTVTGTGYLLQVLPSLHCLDRFLSQQYSVVDIADIEINTFISELFLDNLHLQLITTNWQ